MRKNKKAGVVAVVALIALLAGVFMPIIVALFSN